MLTSLAQIDVCGIGVRVGMRRLDGRGKPAAERNVEDLIHMVGRDELERAAHGRVDLFQILFVLTRDDDRRDANAHGSHRLFLQAADRQDTAAQRDLTRHGKIAAHGRVRERGDDRDADRDAG